MKKNMFTKIAVAACLSLANGGDPAFCQNQDRTDNTIYKVVINHEEQYSIWPAHRENPLGWSDVGKSGTKEECLEYIKEVWTDMRPLTLRKKMEEMEKQRQTQGSVKTDSNLVSPAALNLTNADTKTLNGVSVLKLSGKVTIGSGDVALRNLVRQALDSGAKKILLNLESVTVIDSSGVGELVSAYTTANNRGGTLRICCLPEKVRDILQTTQLITVFDVYKTEADGVASFGK